MTKLKTSQLYRVTKTQTPGPLGRYLIFQFTLTDIHSPDPNKLRVQKMRLQLQGWQWLYFLVRILYPISWILCFQVYVNILLSSKEYLCRFQCVCEK